MVSSCNIYVFLLVFTHGKHVLVNLLISRILEQIYVAIGSRALFFQLWSFGTGPVQLSSAPICILKHFAYIFVQDVCHTQHGV